MATKIELLSHEDKVLSPITKASNVLFENGKTAQDILNDKQDENFTPKITSSSSMFKVGQGDNVDYSANVVNGAYESMVLKGKSMVNCIQESSSQDVVLPYEFTEGQYVTINDTKESGALGVELKGQTLVNLYPKINNRVLTLNSDYDNLANIHQKSFEGKQTYEGAIAYTLYDIKPSTTYTLIYEIISNGITNNGGYNINNPTNGCVFAENIVIRNTDIPGVYKKLMTSKTDLSSSYSALRMQNEHARGTLEIGNIMLIEGDYTNVDIPYFEGMASCKMPILKSVGKNLLPYNEMFVSPFTSATPYITKNVATFPFTLGVNGRGVGIKFKVEPNTTYTLSSNVVIPNTVVGVAFYKNESDTTNHNNKLGIAFSTNIEESTKTFTTPNECNWIVCGIYILYTYEQSGGTVVISEMPKLQLEKNTQVTSYEPNKTSILSLPEEVVLRSLPNGVCDTFNTRTGVYTQYIVERVLDGSENWGLSGALPDNTTFTRFDFDISGLLATAKYPLNCDKLPYIFIHSISGGSGAIAQECITNHSGNETLSIVIKKDKLTEVNATGFKQWLSQNPLTVQYQLATPIVTKINLPSTLKSWNTTTHIYSEIPENTLYPILSHSNPTYPVILKPSTKYSIVTNSYSNNHTNSAINFNLGGATASTTVGNRVTTITTLSTLSNELLTMSGRGNMLNNVMVIEGDVVGDEPYFEGICDCKSPILSNVGKNLANVDNYVNYPSENLPIIKDGEHSYIIENKKVANWQNRVVDKVKLKANTTYTLSYDYELLSASVPMNYGVIINLRDDSDTDINISGDALAGKPRTFTPTRDTLARLCMYATDTSGGMNRIKFSNIQLEESSNRTEYEPYKSNILSCETYFNETTQSDKTIVLRSLPSGVCDTLNVETGEYIKRIGEKTFSGANNEGWTIANNGIKANTIAFGYSGLNGATRNTNVLCDTFIYPVNYPEDREGIQTQSGIQGQIYISIFTSKLSTPDDAGFKAWLQANPVTVQYELATPIISTIDIQGFPFAYENGHVQLSSGSIEQSLTPKVEYSVATNRNGQIRSNQKMVERHQKQLDQLQAIILANLINSQYQQTLTTLKYELSRV